MKEKLFEFYKNEDRSYALVYKRMKGWYYSNQILVALIMLNLLAFLIILISIKQTYKPIQIASMIFVALIVALSFVRYYFNKNLQES